MGVRKLIFAVWISIFFVTDGQGQPVTVDDHQLLEAYQCLEKVFLIHYIGLQNGEQNLEKYFEKAQSILETIFPRNAVVTFSAQCHFRRNSIDIKKSSYRIELSRDGEENIPPIVYFFYPNNKDVLCTLPQDEFKSIIIKIIADEQGNTFTISKTAGTWAGIKVNCEIIEIIQ